MNSFRGVSRLITNMNYKEGRIPRASSYSTIKNNSLDSKSPLTQMIVCEHWRDETKENATRRGRRRLAQYTKLLLMFLGSLFRSAQQQAYCQTTFYSLPQATGSNMPRAHQRTTIDHMRATPFNIHQHHNQPLGSDRRLTANQMNFGPVKSIIETKSDKGGKMLVCYYTNNVRGWPAVRESREFLIPADNLANIQASLMFPRSPSQFGPLFSTYDPLTHSIQQQLRHNNQIGKFNGVKNQQLVSRQRQQQEQQQNFLKSDFKVGIGKSPNSIGANNWKVKQQHQDSMSHIIATRADHLTALGGGSLGLSGASTGFVFGDAAGGKSQINKQTPAYNFIEGDLDGHGALIVSSQLTRSVNHMGQASLIPLSSNSEAPPMMNGNNGVNLIAASGRLHQQTATSRNEANNDKRGDIGQQLVLSPHTQSLQLPSSSQSRASIVSPNLAGGTSNNNNNEFLDTKSQLFFPSTVATSSSRPTSAAVGLFSSSTMSTAKPVILQQQVLENQHKQHRAKNLHFAPESEEQFPSGKAQQQLYQYNKGSLFSGAVSSAPPLPLSSASLRQQQLEAARNAFPVTSATNQALIVSNNNFPLEPLGFVNSQTLKSNPLSSTTSGSSTTSAALASSSPTAASSTQSELPDQQQQIPLFKNNLLELAGSTSQVEPAAPVLVSSPLSSVFDVLGAAGQYLMRFKPSSLISPSAFAGAFNSASGEQQAGIYLNSIQSKLSNSSLNSNLAIPSTPAAGKQQPQLSQAVNSPADFNSIPLPLSSNALISSKSSNSNPNFNDRAGSPKVAESGFLSRFSLGQSNQRREDVCGRTIQTPQRRIIGGEGARYGEFPYQVHIKIAKHQCGGALVDKQSIVTAAHCVYHFITRAPVSKLQIVIGAYDIEDEQYQELPPQYFKVNKVKLHPNFRFSASHPDRYDIAILKLDKPVKYTDNVLPVCLPSKELKFENMVGTVTGFGKTDPSLSNRYGTRLLQKVDVPIIENNECERWHRTRGIDLKIFPEMMCAGYEDGLKDACVGDSGGPLVVKTPSGPNGTHRWTLAGITSAGFGCAQSRQPGIYHRVSHTVDWILENLD